MKKALIVIDSSKNKEHEKLSHYLEESLEKAGWKVQSLDFKTEIQEFNSFRTMADYKPELLITLDLAGFCMKTDAEEASYNRIPCRMAHLLFSSYREYEEILARTINFSMYFFTGSRETALQMQKEFPHIEHIMYLEELPALWKLHHVEPNHLPADIFIQRMLSEMEF